MNSKLLILLVWLLLATLPGFAQNKTVQGQVLSQDDNMPLPGVNIVEKGTSSGTVTDSEGRFSISVKENTILVFSFVGYTSQEVNVGAQTTLNISLTPDIMSLSEVVVVGYGSQEKKDVTGSLQAISPKDLNKGVISSPQDMLVGKIAGVQVTSNDGSPGAGSTIRIRGNGSIQASQDPLIVIDGFPVDNNSIGGSSNPLSSINPNDIETFTVLKDAAATAIYGLRASNGVIIITTKKGKEGKPQVSYSGNFSLSNPMKTVDVLSGDEMRSLAASLLDEGNLSGLTTDAVERLGDDNTDWQKEIYQTAFAHDHNISVSGTVNNFPYRVSYGYTNQDGILKTTNFKRNSLNINLTPEFLDGDLKLNASFKGSYTNQNFGNTGAVGAAVAFDPTQPVYNGSSRWGGFFSWVGPAAATELDPNGDPLTLATSNPVALLKQTDNRSDVYRAIGTLQVDYRLPFMKEIKLTANAGFDFAKSDGHNNAPPNAAFTYSATGSGQLIDYTGENKSRLLDLYANYNKTIGKHTIDATVGYSYQRFDRDGSNFDRNGDQTVYNDYQLDGDGNEVPRQYIPNPNVLLSFFGRINYSLNGRYLLTLSARDDASSRFAEENRWVVFPAAGFAWRVSEESFMQNVKGLSDLKVRVSYGITGQQDVSGNNPYPYLSTYQLSSATSQYQLGGIFYNTYRPQPYDSDLRWETTAQTNLGIDFGVFNGKLTGTVDLYKRETTDLINRVPVAAGSNFSNYLITNVGSLVNQGIEVTLNATPIEREDFEWSIGANFTRNDNEVTKLLNTNDPSYIGILTGGIGLQKNIQNIQVGYPINSFFVYQQVYENGKPIEGLYVDLSGNGGDVTASEANKYRYHSPLPDYTIGINSKVNYKKFDFYFSGRLSVGNYVYNNVLTGANYSNFYYSTGYFNNLPRAVADTEFYSLQSFSDYYVENASFFKMDNISLGYNFDEVFTNKLKGRVSLTVQNAFFISDYSGIDPEVGSGIDNNIYPRSRVFMLGINLTY